MPEVELIDLTHPYGTQIALDNIQAQFIKGNITAIIGRSGSGKSTLLKCINGLIRPMAGKVLIAGQPLNRENISSQRHKMGYVVQGNGLFPHLSTFENITVSGKITGQSDQQAMRARTLELLALVDLPEKYINRYPGDLSGGEQQRVALARAMFLSPPILLMDEPFASLDPITRREISTKIRELQKLTGLTIIIVTHDVAETNRLADDVLVLDKGKVQQSGTKESVFQSPANAAVQQLISIGAA